MTGEAPGQAYYVHKECDGLTVFDLSGGFCSRCHAEGLDEGDVEQRRAGDTPGTTPEAITEDELEQAVRDLATRTGNWNAYFPDLARNIFGYVRGHLREPEHQSGDCVQDAQGRPFIRSGGCSWVAWSGARVNDDELERPLRRLVPLPAREDLLAALEESVSREHGYEGQASRVLALLEGKEVSGGQ